MAKFLLWLIDFFRMKLDPKLEAQVAAFRTRARQLDREYADLKHANSVKERLIAEETRRRDTLAEELVSLTREGDEIDRKLREVRSETPAVPGGPADWLRADL